MIFSGSIVKFKSSDKRQPQHQPPRLSRILTGLAVDETRERVTINDIRDLMSQSASAALVFVFAAPNVLPVPPGVSAILGLPLIYLTAQLMLGQQPWLPDFIAGRSFARADFAAFINRAMPVLARAEKLLRPRWAFFLGYGAERLVGVLCLVLACVIALPIPLGNMLPAAALCLICLGLIERDGLCVALGVLTAIISLLIVAAVVWAMIKTLFFIILNAF